MKLLKICIKYRKSEESRANIFINKETQKIIPKSFFLCQTFALHFKYIPLFEIYSIIECVLEECPVFRAHHKHLPLFYQKKLLAYSYQ